MAESGGLAIRGSEQVGAAVVAVGVLLVLILMSGPLALGDGVPATIRRQVDDNGEASMYAALMIVLLTEPLVSRAFVRRIWWTVVAIGLVATSSVGHWTGLSGWLMTLRESFAAAAIVAIYLSVPTRYRRRVSAYVAVVAMTVAVELSLVVIGHSGPALLMQEHAETVGMVLLTAVLVDVLEPRPATLGRPAPSWARIAWCGALVASVVVLLIVDPDEVLATAGASSSVSDQLLVWAARNLESLLGVLAVSIWLFALGTSRVAATSPAATTGISSASDPRPHTT